SRNTISNIRDDGGNMAGIYIYELYEGAFVDLHANTITPHEDGASDGIHVEYVEYGSVMDFLFNDISGFGRAGIYFLNDIYEGAIVTIRKNVIDGGEDSIRFQAY